MTLEALAKRVTHLKARGNKVVLAHGVFDLLHIGHIRYFKQAKKLGDILIVTVTADLHVNKGPHRPVFTEHLRAEAIAAIECVSYVAINEWPMAVETIQTIRPDIYVKGSEYRETEKDKTGGIIIEEEAIRSVGGRIAFIEDITFSSSSLINQHLSSFPEEVGEYLRGFSGRHDSDKVVRCVESTHQLKVLVIGEAIIDEYQYCEAIGKSSKEPMLALKHLSDENFAGGILAVGNHVANFCDEVGLITFLGEVKSQEEFVREHLNSKVEATFLYRKKSPTIVKRRFIESYFFSKLLEVYEMNDDALSESDNEMLCAVLSEQVPRYDVVIVVDFGHGMLSREAIEIICSKARFLAVNVQSNAGNHGYHTISRYPRADYVSLAGSEAQLEARDRRGDLKRITLDISQKLDCGRVVVTRGRLGCLCYSEREGFFQVPAFAGQVVDRVGAGDAFLSVTALCAANGAPMEVIGFIGNAVGAQAVATVGNRQPIERVHLVKHIQSLLK